MDLPSELAEGIEKAIAGIGLNDLSAAAAQLSQAYRKETPNLSTAVHHLAYLTSRLPATFAAVSAVMGEIKERLPELSLSSLLDLGAGPGTAMWAVAEHFSEIERITLVERDPHFLRLGKELASGTLKRAEWLQKSLSDFSFDTSYDLVVSSYALGELQPELRKRVVEEAWKVAGKLFVVIEPGTPAGFERIREIRTHLIELGGQMVAPCPHARACPMQGGDWCHFSVRLPRSSYHRQMKGGALGYEDEKYSYVAISKQPAPLPNARVLRHPMKHSGHVELTLCAQEGLQKITVSRKEGDRYRIARKAEWGCAWLC